MPVVFQLLFLRSLLRLNFEIRIIVFHLLLEVIQSLSFIMSPFKNRLEVLLPNTHVLLLVYWALVLDFLDQSIEIVLAVQILPHLLLTHGCEMHLGDTTRVCWKQVQGNR